MTTEYHAKLFAHELSKKRSVSDAEKLAGTLLDAQVDLNPHQVEAALFAFKSSLSKGAILADEVGPRQNDRGDKHESFFNGIGQTRTWPQGIGMSALPHSPMSSIR